LFYTGFTAAVYQQMGVYYLSKEKSGRNFVNQVKLKLLEYFSLYLFNEPSTNIKNINIACYL
jgi:hypothetical protein